MHSFMVMTYSFLYHIRVKMSKLLEMVDLKMD